MCNYELNSFSTLKEMLKYENKPKIGIFLSNHENDILAQTLTKGKEDEY